MRRRGDAMLRVGKTQQWQPNGTTQVAFSIDGILNWSLESEANVFSSNLVVYLITIE